MKNHFGIKIGFVLAVFSLAALSPAPIHDGTGKFPAPVKSEQQREIDQTQQRTQTEVGNVPRVDNSETVASQQADPAGAAVVKDVVQERQAKNAKQSLLEAEAELEREKIHKEILLMWLLGVLTIVGISFYVFKRMADSRIPIPFGVQARHNEHLAKQKSS